MGLSDKTVRRGSARTFLCGYFNWSDTVESVLQGWEKQTLTPDYKHWCPELDERSEVVKDRNYWCQLYYESFVDSLLQKGGHWVKETDIVCSIADKQTDGAAFAFEFKVKRLHFFRFPSDKCLFSIELYAQDVDLNDLTFMHFVLRENSLYDKVLVNNRYSGFDTYLRAVEPLKLMSPDGGYAGWVDTGGKLKAFQIVGTDTVDDALLYELGTMVAVGAVNNQYDSNSPAQSYYDTIMNENKISVFRNWTALALLDTVTVISNSKDSKGKGLDMNFVWAASYFRMLYIHVLYQKICLFEINRKFRDEEKDAIELVEEMKKMEKDYSFPTVSYNFLPQLIYEKMKHGLEVDKEREQIHRYVEQEGKRQEKERDKQSADAEKKLANSVLGLTILTLASVLYDLTSYIYELVGTESVCCRRWVAAGVLIVVLATVYILFKRYIDEWTLCRWIKGRWKRKSNAQ